MTEIERLRADLATLKKAYNINRRSVGYYECVMDEIVKVTSKIADLEAQQELIDPWQTAKKALAQWESVDSLLNSKEKRAILAYVRNLQAKVAELYDELHSVRIDGGKVRDDQKAEISELKAKTEREQLELCKECSHPLSDCGPLGVDGTPTADCKVCQLKAQIAEMEQHGRKVDQANHEHYGRLQDQIAIRDLKIEKLERQAPAERNREKLAELTTIANAIPPACGIFFYSEQLRETLELARDLVKRRIEGIKREMQGNGD